MRRVVITGLGAITPLGLGAHHTWQRLLASHSGIVSLSQQQPPSESQSKSPSSSSQWASLPSQVAGLVPTSGSSGSGSNKGGSGGGNSSSSATDRHYWQASDWIDKGEERRMGRFTQYAVATTEMAMRDAGWQPRTEEERERSGVCLGSGIGNLEELVEMSGAYERGGYKKVSPLFVPKLLINLAAGHISMKYGLRGPNHAVSTACTTGAHAIGDASRFISYGDADVMIAGGSESCIQPLAIAGFARSRSLATEYNHDPTASSRPFDVDRCGFVMAEGAGVVLLEELEHAKARGADIYAEIVGYGCSADAYHMTAPREDGSGALLAMRKALRNAGIAPREVGYINAHATSTLIGDAAENAAIETLMLGPEGVERAGEVTVSSTKGAVGHLLGAAGAVEAIFSILAVKENIIPPTLNLHKPSPGFHFNYAPLHAQQKLVKAALSNSFGFGGTNASLAFAKYG